MKTYHLEYRNANGNIMADLSKKRNLKNAIVEYVTKWVSDNTTENNLPDYITWFSISENSVRGFSIGHDEVLSLEVVND